MLADPRSESLVTNFAFQWLNVRTARRHRSRPDVFPDFDADLRDALREEMQLFVDSILRDDRSVLDLLTRDHTFVNERLALPLRHHRTCAASSSGACTLTIAPLRAARQGQRADGDVVPGSHVAGAARCVDPREHPRHAAGAAAAERQTLLETQEGEKSR